MRGMSAAFNRLWSGAEAETSLEARGLAAKALDLSCDSMSMAITLAALPDSLGPIIPVLATQGTITAMGCAFWADVTVARISPHQSSIDGVVIEPIPATHDAREPASCGSNATYRLGIVMDLGHRTAHLMASAGLMVVRNSIYDEAFCKWGSIPQA